MNGLYIPAAALIISVATLIFSALSLRRKADDSYVEDIEERVDRLIAQLKECESRCERLRQDNLDLMHEIFRLKATKQDKP